MQCQSQRCGMQVRAGDRASYKICKLREWDRASLVACLQGGLGLFYEGSMLTVRSVVGEGEVLVSATPTFNKRSRTAFSLTLLS